jgi:hypothetical protein
MRLPFSFYLRVRSGLGVFAVMRRLIHFTADADNADPSQRI